MLDKLKGIAGRFESIENELAAAGTPQARITELERQLAEKKRG